ncbi:MAG: ABC transporter ATP-binding protein [Oscillospiraceae bacterium]|nr:ABC transporter ATP-binding protein [Oscillospiraceae bacterium]
MEPLLKVNNVSIAYKLGDFKDIGLKEWVTRHLTKNFHVEQFMAVDGVSFELHKGELLGIVGANGAGKSTILKAVAGIMEPRSGSIERRGNVAALLELGSGFDGELTVKENAYLRGAMLGYDEKFMDETYAEILRFAELEKYADRPFKQLSTGMQSRLAFAIASLVEPEILVLDEVLSVGDGAFQEKSAKKMREIIRGGAATILVSHSLSQIRELSTKVLWLHQGRQVALGETQRICDRYQAFLDGDETAMREDWVAVEKEADLMPLMLPRGETYKLNFGYGIPPQSSLCGPCVYAPAGEYHFTVEVDAADEFPPLTAQFSAECGAVQLQTAALSRGINHLRLFLDQDVRELELVFCNSWNQHVFLTGIRVDPGLHR